MLRPTACKLANDDVDNTAAHMLAIDLVRVLLEILLNDWFLHVPIFFATCYY